MFVNIGSFKLFFFPLLNITQTLFLKGASKEEVELFTLVLF